MKIIKSMLIGAVLSIPLFVSATDRVKEIKLPTNTFGQIESLIAKQAQRYYRCPAGWTKVLDITNNKGQWGEVRPVLICKPNKGIMSCPPGTYFYIKGVPFEKGIGEIGCTTSVQ